MIWKQGDIVRISFDPTKGHERAGYRPALIIQNNDLTALIKSVVVVMPISNTVTRLPFQVPLDSRTKTTGSVLCRQIRAVDLDTRKTEFVEKIPYDLLKQCLDYLGKITEITPEAEY